MTLNRLSYRMARWNLMAVMACLLFVCSLFVSTARADDPIKVFILAGQSNMEGKARVSLLETQITAEETRDQFAHYHDEGEWVEREDVWIKFLNRKGDLKVGYGSPNCIGPELEFGFTMGDQFDEQVLIIKTAWGGKSLFRDFRPPSSGLPADEVLETMLANQQNRRPETTMDEVRDSFGHFYRLMIEDVKQTTANLDEHFPEYADQGFEIAGFVWFQGWNDMINTDYTAEYAENMANFIRDVRSDLEVPALPFVIGQLGVDGVSERPNEKRDAFKAAQAAPVELEEFAGNVAVVPTDVLWDMRADEVYRRGWRENLEEWNTVGSDRPYHYLGSCVCHQRMGRAFAEAVLALMAD